MLAMQVQLTGLFTFAKTNKFIELRSPLSSREVCIWTLTCLVRTFGHLSTFFMPSAAFAANYAFGRFLSSGVKHIVQQGNLMTMKEHPSRMGSPRALVQSKNFGLARGWSVSPLESMPKCAAESHEQAWLRPGLNSS